jgi:hypothetical protein
MLTLSMLILCQTVIIKLDILLPMNNTVMLMIAQLTEILLVAKDMFCNYSTSKSDTKVAANEKTRCTHPPTHSHPHTPPLHTTHTHSLSTLENKVNLGCKSVIRGKTHYRQFLVRENEAQRLVSSLVRTISLPSPSKCLSLFLVTFHRICVSKGEFSRIYGFG